MQYKVLQSVSIKGLEALVNNALKEGWGVLGGVAVVELPRSDHFSYSQAVVKPE